MKLSGPVPPVIELRRYLLRPGAADAFVALFDRELMDTQETPQMHGMRVLGQFVELPDRAHFVWLRGFPGMDSRAEGLAAFYGGPVWAAHGAAANALMLDSDDVLLLRPVDSPTFAPDAGAGALVVVTVWSLAEPAEHGFLAFFRSRVEPVLVAGGAPSVALLVTDPSPNTFPRLPVREGEHVLVRISRAADEAGLVEWERRLTTSHRWRELSADLAARTLGEPVVLPLTPTPRSRFR